MKYKQCLLLTFCLFVKQWCLHFCAETKKESSIAKHGSSNGKSSNKPVKSDSLTRNDGLFTSSKISNNEALFK